VYKEPTNNNNNNIFLVDVCNVSIAAVFSTTKSAVTHKCDIATCEKETTRKGHKTKQHNVDFLKNKSGLKGKMYTKKSV